MKPGLSHALLALGMQWAIAVPILIVSGNGLLATASGALFSAGFYVGRERRQSEEHYGSNRIPVWWWKPRALRDLGWPLLAVSAPVAALTAYVCFPW